MQKDRIQIINTSHSWLASSDNKIIKYKIAGHNKTNTAIIKDVGRIPCGRGTRPLPENTIYYEVAIADLMQRLGLKTVKKMLMVDFVKNPHKSYVASEWEYGLKNYTSLMLWKGKILFQISQLLTITGALKYWLSLYKQNNIKPQQKEFYKMCACLTAVGMIDLKPGDNIMENKEGLPVAVDTGFNYFTLDSDRETYKAEEWQECIDILKTNNDEEVKKWGEVISQYKDYILSVAEKKERITLNFKNIVEEGTQIKRCEIDEDKIQRELEIFTPPPSKEKPKQPKYNQVSRN